MTSVGTWSNSKTSTKEPFCDRVKCRRHAKKNNHRALRDLKPMTDGSDIYNLYIFKNAATKEGKM
jgi:hypothetical protein